MCNWKCAKAVKTLGLEQRIETADPDHPFNLWNNLEDSRVASCSYYLLLKYISKQVAASIFSSLLSVSALTRSLKSRACLQCMHKALLHKNVTKRCRKVSLDFYIQNEDSKVQDSYPMHLVLTSFMVWSVFLKAVKNSAMFSFLLLFILFPILNNNKW